MENNRGNGLMPEVTIHPWAEEDIQLLKRMNTAKMWASLGGPERDDGVIARHQRYLHDSKVHFFAIKFGSDSIGSVGYWERRWKEHEVYETGWKVIPEFQGRGIATRAMSELLNILRNNVQHAIVYAFPSTNNTASNEICRKLGFSLVGETDFEFPKGKWMKSNEWCLRL
ncbi:GNAT family N-acetyltransferase [Alicyclobacillus fastidiosus]|uniref:GNAT family protein n=1 Tax=Alicyclobacillus fastidiosus TaxID=392011 RepID=A0ABV5AGI2_9BACL|nr:GNAT family protein [Alicyclobacillus fastidiosus]WEH07973.1 GNAT family protein [Alicyclobacillus fastidiosus]